MQELIAGPDLQPDEPMADRGTGKRPGGSRRRQSVFEAEGRARVSTHSVHVAKGGRWVGRIEVPAEGDVAALLTIERKGKGTPLLPKDAALVIPEGEAEVVLTLLQGLFAKARRNGIL